MIVQKLEWYALKYMIVKTICYAMRQLNVIHICTEGQTEDILSICVTIVFVQGQPALYYFEKLYKENKGDIDREVEVNCVNMITLLKEKMPECRGKWVVSGKYPG